MLDKLDGEIAFICTHTIGGNGRAEIYYKDRPPVLEELPMIFVVLEAGLAALRERFEAGEFSLDERTLH